MESFIECYDVGGTNIRGALIDGKGTITAMKWCETQVGGYKQLIGQIIDLSRALRNAVSPFPRGLRILSVSLGLPGPVKGGVLRESPPLHLRSELDVVNELGKHFMEPIYVENDVNLAAKAEMVFGSGKEISSFYVLALSTGIGVGIVWNGTLLSGAACGEFGHCVLERGPDKANLCSCGRQGCWVAMSSGHGITVTLAKSSGRDMAAADLFSLYEQGSPCAKAIVAEVRGYNAHGIGNMLNALPVQRIVVMGSLGLAQFTRVIPSAEEIARYTINDVPPIMPTTLGDTIGLLGAYAFARERLSHI